ncbi:MAG: GIY-YIG nuclease family protein [Clostridium saudiense]|uniref:GIY-YIG nuclease family protein n=1 Tax=Clostridium saudiense TaxID=1414720 RepID=UPI00319E916F
MSEFKEVLKAIQEIDDNIGIYAIVLEVVKIIYIGQSIDIKRRLSQHKNSLMSKCHFNKNFQEEVWSIGINDLEYETLYNCPRHLLRDFERHYIGLFKSMGYTVFGDNDNSDKFRSKNEYIGYSGYEEDYINKLEERYLIIIKAYQNTICKNKIRNKELSYNIDTDFLMNEMIEGLKRYEIENCCIKGVLDSYLKADVQFVEGALNYVAFNIFKSIYKEESWYEKNMFGRGKIFQSEYINYYTKTMIDTVILEVRSKCYLTDDLFKINTLYTSRVLELEDYDLIYITDIIIKSGKIKAKSMFDFLYYYILLMYCRKIVKGYYLIKL